MAFQGSQAVVLAALAGNAAIAATKLAAAAYTGSSAMLSEAIHSLADTGNQGLLLWGARRSRRSPDERHPFGYASEIYFWGFIVTVVLFAMGAGVSIYEGAQKILEPKPIENAGVNYLVLAASFCFEGISAAISYREFNRRRGQIPALEAIRASKDPSLFTVLVEDTVALAGLIIAALGIAAASWLGFPEADGLASIAIGLLLGAAAVFLAREVKSLLIGEAAGRLVRLSARRIVEQHAGGSGPIRHINDIRTLQLGPSDVLAIVSVDLDDAVRAREVEALAATLQEDVRSRVPEVSWLFLDVRSQARYARPTALAQVRDGRAG